MKNWKGQFKEEFGIHFSKSELLFVLEFIEELLSKQKEGLKDKETFSPEFEAGERSMAKAVLERIEKGLGLEHIKLLCLAISVSQR